MGLGKGVLRLPEKELAHLCPQHCRNLHALCYLRRSRGKTHRLLRPRLFQPQELPTPLVGVPQGISTGGTDKHHHQDIAKFGLLFEQRQVERDN